MIWPWQRERRAKRVALAALGASVEDERLDPDRILEAAAAEHGRLRGVRSGAAVQPLRARFGSPQVGVLLRLSRPDWRGLDEAAEPHDVSVHVGRRNGLRLVDFQLTPETGRAEAAVYVTARARSWTGKGGFRSARLEGWIVKTLLSGITLNPGVGMGTLPRARARRLRAFWVFELPEGDGDWAFDRFEALPSGSYRFSRTLDESVSLHRRLREDLVLEAAVADTSGLKIPWEIADSLPYDARAAVLELSGLFEAFAPQAVDASVRRIIELWAQASEGEPEALDSAASPKAREQLLSPPGTVLRGPELAGVRPLRVRAFRVPPELTVEVDVRAYLGLSDPGEYGVYAIRRRHKLWWRLARQDLRDLPWRLVDAEVDPFRP